MRKKKHAEHENLERWLVSYADFMTLLFALFTTMYAISNVDAQKMGRMVLSMQAAFDPTGFASLKATSIAITTGTGEKKSNNSMFLRSLMRRQNLEAILKAKRKNTIAPIKKDQLEGDLERIKTSLSQIVMDDALRDKVHIIIKGHGVVISLSEAGFFDSGTHLVRSKSLPLLEKISKYLLTLPNRFRVEGHTDNQPINTFRYPSNWELSTARATYIVAYLIKEHGFDPKRLSAAGYAEYRPVDTNETAEGRARNRRVDIIIPALSNIEEDNEGE